MDIIDYITMATTGDSTDFGDLAATRTALGGASNGTRGVFGGGEAGGPASSVIEHVTIQSTGNASAFGDLTVARRLLGACSGT